MQTNLTRALQLRTARRELTEYIETGDLALLKALGFIMLEQDWAITDLEADLGSEAIERLLQEAQDADYEKLQETLGHLNFE